MRPCGLLRLCGILSVFVIPGLPHDAGGAWAPVAKPTPATAFTIKGRVPFLSAVVNGQPRAFILDTGASETVLTPRVAQAAGLRVRDDPNRQQLATLDSFRIGEAGVENLAVMVFDPPQARPLRLNAGLDYAGVVGFSFLRRFVVDVDYAASELRLHDPVAYRRLQARDAPGVPAGDGVAFTLVSSLVHVPGVVDGRHAVTCLIDTGAAEVVVTPAAAQRMGLAMRPLGNAPGIGLAVLTSLAVAGAERRGMEVIVHTIPQDRGRAVRYDIIVGTPFLEAFRLTLDYPRKRLTLTPHASPAPAPAPR